MNTETVVIIGGGIAGLAAARELARRGARVTLLEARARLGGRILTHHAEGRVPVELGAEFVHGHSPALWELLTEIPLATREVPAHHQVSQPDGSLVTRPFPEDIRQVTREIDRAAPDETFARFLDRHAFPP